MARLVFQTRSDSRRRTRELAGGDRRAWIGLVAALSGGVLLAIAAAQTFEGVLAQALARSSLPSRGVAEPSAPRSIASPSAAPAADPPPPVSGDLVGRLRIPAAGMDLAVFEGVSADVLRRGPGHVPGTGLPTQGRNCVIAGHRDSFFRRLADVKVGDRVFLTGEEGEREYRLASRRVVSPTEISVLAPTQAEQVTLVTCYPFSWIGPAPYRIVWQALPVASVAKLAEGPPSSDRR